MLVLLLLVFYQPIIFTVVKLVAPRFAAKENLRIDSLGLGGTILTSLRVENLHVTPTAPGPIARANVGHLELHYSLPTLIRHGLNSDFITSVTLHDADIVYDSSKSPPSPPKKKEPFSLPPLPLPGSLSLRNVSFELLPASRETAHAAGQSAAASSAVPAPVAPAVAATTEASVSQGLLVKNANLELDPNHDGALLISELRLPGIADLHDVSARTSYRNRDLQLADLTLAPDIHVRLLSIDGSKLEQQLLSVSLDADLFKGRAGLAVNLKGIGTPPDANVKLDVSGLSLASVGDFFKVGTPPDNTLGGTLDNLTLRFDGNSNLPKSWNGRLAVHVTRPSFGATALDSVSSLGTFRDGAVDIQQTDVSQGENHVAVRAHLDLADTMADLPNSNGRGTLEINAPDFAKLPVKLPVAMTGALHVGGDFTLAGAKFGTALKGHVQSLAIPAQQVSVTGVDFAVDVSKTIPKDATAAPTAPGAPPPPHEPFYKGLQTRVAANVENIRYTDYAVDGVNLALTSNDAAVKLDHVEITRGPNRIDVDGTYRIPDDFDNAQKSPLDARLSIAIPDLTQFAVDPKNPVLPLQGRLNAKGNVSAVNGVYGGGFDLEGNDLKAKGATVQTANVQIGIENNQATVKTGHIVFDDKNTVDLDGHGNLQAPYPFDAGLNVNLTDLSRFNPVLAANGVNEPLAGSVNVTGKVGGHLATAPGANDQKIDGSLNVTARDLKAHGQTIASVDTQVVVENNRAVIKTGQIKVDAKSGLTFGGQADLAAPYPFTGNLDVNLPDLGSFAPLLQATGGTDKQKVGGSIHLTGEAKGHLATAPDANDQDINGTLNLTGANIEAKGAKIASLNGEIVAANKLAVIKTLQVKVDDKNTLDISGQAATVAPFDYRANLNINLLDLGSFKSLLKAATTKPTDTANATAAKIDAAASATTPAVHGINGPKSRNTPDTPANLTTKTQTRHGPVVVEVKGAPRSPGRAEFVQAGNTKLAADETKLGGSLQVQWQAQGNFAKAPDGPKFSGGGTIKAHQVEFDAVGPLEADIEGKYSQQVIDFPVFFVGSNGLEFRTVIGLKDALARVDQISLKQGPTELLAGYIQIPLDLNQLSAPGGPIPDVDKIDVNVASKPLSLETLFGSIDKTKKTAPPAQGTVQLQVDAHGSLSKIVADVKLSARQLRSPQTPTLRPADADVDLTLKNDRLDLNTVVRQPQIAPLTIKGNVPLDLHALAASKQFDPKSPVDLTIQLPRSSLNFLGGVTKAIRYVQGDAAIGIKVGGTIEKPAFSGDAELNIAAARADNITVPAVRDFHARLAFANNDLRIEQFTGEIGGGKINVGGHVGFAKLTEPTIDIAAKADDVLAVRDDNLTARVNADVKVVGPFAAASVTGSIGITKSRYLKDIDIVPLNTPGKPAPAPPAPSSGGEASIGVNVAPINAWKLDLAIKTDDPFVIRGNLAHGTALVDLHIKGTGGQPLLDGNVEIKDLLTTLPFSTLDIADGNIAFTPDKPLDPVLDIQGTSTIRDYLVTVYVTGRAKDPKVTFSSDPPATQEQIVSLLATGSTPDELAGNAQALAGKATLLVIQDLYRRTFPKKQSAREEPKSTLADKFSLDVGGTDPATGKQQVGATYKINDNYQFVADLGLEGDLRGRLQYLIRFPLTWEPGAFIVGGGFAA